MAITTTITSAAAPYTKVTPVPFTITFSDNVTGLVLNALVATGGSVIRLDGSGAVYTAYVSPSSQGGTVSLRVPAGVATGPAIDFEPNAESNTLVVGFLSIKPRAQIEHELSPVTNSHNLRVSIIFDRDVTGFVANDFSFVNATLHSLSGSGSVYTANILPQKIGQVEFWINEDAGTDIYGNTSARSNTVVLVFDPTSYTEKENAVFGEITDREVLLNFELAELAEVAEIQNLADCAKNLPQRLLQFAQDKAFEILSKNSDVKKLANMVAIVQQQVETVKAIVEQVQRFADNPETLMQAVLDSQGLTGNALRAKMQQISTQFGNVSGLNNIIEGVKSTGICGQQDYYADGSFAPRRTLTPTDVLPPQIPGVIAGVQNNTYDPVPKDQYDEFTFQLKEQLELDSSQPQDSDRAKMLSIVTTLTMGYHDSISKTTDDSKDQELFTKYESNVENEKARNLGWEQSIKDSFAVRTQTAGSIIQRNTTVIRAFYNRNQLLGGGPVSIGITTYSGPESDFTTFLDIKPEQRPPALTARYLAEGKRIPAGNTYTNSAGKTFRIGTLNYSDAFKGAYGKQLVSDRSVASTRFPGGSILSLRNPDGTVYDPTGKNPSGHYSVDDTGNAELTYKKVDVFTLTPQLYRNMQSVQVFLVKMGTVTNRPQYVRAQQKFGRGSVA